MAGLQTSGRASHSALAGTSGGNPAPPPSALAQAVLEGDLAGKVHALASDPKDGLAAALARLGRRSWHETPDFLGVQQMRRNTPQS